MATQRVTVLLLLFIAGAFLTPASWAKPPIEAFGDVPHIRAAQLSPDGTKVAYLNRIDGQDILAIHDLEARKATALARVTDLKANSVSFISDRYIVLVASRTHSLLGFRGKWEDSNAFVVDLETGKNVQLLRRTEGIFPAQSGLGNIVAVDDEGEHVYMPAYMGSAGSDPSLDLLKVSLKSGQGLKRYTRDGVRNTVDWITNSRGEVIAREDYDERNKVHEIRVPDGRTTRTIFKENTELLSRSLIGVSPSGDKLIASERRDSEFRTLYEMSIADGTLTGPILEIPNSDIDGVIVDDNRVVLGVRYAGMFPTYRMFDAEVEKAIKVAQDALPNSTVALTSWSRDWSKLLFYVGGGDMAQRYVMYDRTAGKILTIANMRPDIKPEDVGEVITVEYKARDGLTIPAIITWPAGVAEDKRTNLPLVVLPHGGPEAYDSVDFDWLAQFLANEGYMVLQPNFRGSAGFGAVFRNAGRGEWGRKMQDDITDGTAALARMGWADPARTCIVGWSYGGYAALAGGALTPDLYKCVASIAGVSDLREMLSEERLQHGTRSRTVTYWEMLIGDTNKDREAIDAVSPARLADRFKAPVLLIHGTDDLVVKSSQSDRMAAALRRENKPVEYLKIKGDDHNLQSNESRAEALSALAAFLKTHIGSTD